MTGIIIRAELQDADARRQLEEMMERMDRKKPFYDAVGDRLVGSALENFKRESGPDGKPWTPLKPATIRARKRLGYLPLTILRRNIKGLIGSPLAGSISWRASEDGVRIGSPKIYAAIHQLGGTIDKPAGSRWMAGRRFARRDKHPEGREVAIPAHKIVIPARPYIGISAADEEGILEDAENWLVR